METRVRYDGYMKGIAAVAKQSMPNYDDVHFLIALIDSAIGLCQAGGYGHDFLRQVVETRIKMWRVAEGKEN